MYQKYSYSKKVFQDTSSSSTKRDEIKTPNIKEPKKYIVKPGDTLWDLAAKEYGSGFEYKKIIEKNPGKTYKFKNGREGLIFPGTELVL